MHYAKRDYMKQSNNAGNYAQEENTGYKRPQFWESEYSSGTWHVIEHMGPRFKYGIMQGRTVLLA
jgi:hypothetical protein